MTCIPPLIDYACILILSIGCRSLELHLSYQRTFRVSMTVFDSMRFTLFTKKQSLFVYIRDGNQTFCTKIFYMTFKIQPLKVSDFVRLRKTKKKKSIDPMTDASFAFPYFHASHSAYQSVSVRFVILLPVESDFSLSDIHLPCQSHPSKVHAEYAGMQGAACSIC